MVKEKRDRKPKWDIDKEYPKWAWVDYKLEDTQFFKDVKGFLIEGLDSKPNLIDEHVTTMDIAKFFGNVKTFNSNKPLLTGEARKQIETLYWKINGTGHNINNELMGWFVKGWKAGQNGHPINQVVTIAATIKEKHGHLGTQMKSKGEKLDVNEGSRPSLEVIDLGHVDQKDGKDVNILNLHMLWRNPMFKEDIAKVEKIVDLKHEVQKLNKVQLKLLEDKKRGLQDILLGLKFNMEDP